MLGALEDVLDGLLAGGASELEDDLLGGLGLGGGGGNVGVGVSGGIPIGKMDTYMELTFDFVDIEKDALVWQAVVESSFDVKADPEKRQKIFDRIVEKALEGYPPKK